MSEQRIRTAFRHLKPTSEATSSGTAKCTVISINCCEKYQPVTNTATSDQPAINQQSTNN